MLPYFAVVGNPIQHSLSPFIHHLFAQQFGMRLDYQKIKLEHNEFNNWVNNFFAQQGCGLNVTLPYKEAAFLLATHLTPRCLEAKAANTLWSVAGELHADNTDGIGLVRDLQRYSPLNNMRVLILGAGGAVHGIIGPLLQHPGLSVTVTNRTIARMLRLQPHFPTIHIASVTELQGPFDIIIHASAAGLQGEVFDLPPRLLSNKPFCYDLSYQRDEPTPFVKMTQKAGCNAVDGLGMLVEQAAEAFSIWHQVMPATEQVLQQLRNNDRAT